MLDDKPESAARYMRRHMLDIMFNKLQVKVGRWPSTHIFSILNPNLCRISTYCNSHRKRENHPPSSPNLSGLQALPSLCSIHNHRRRPSFIASRISGLQVCIPSVITNIKVFLASVYLVIKSVDQVPLALEYPIFKYVFYPSSPMSVKVFQVSWHI